MTANPDATFYPPTWGSLYASEVAAMLAYRSRYPDGPPWQELQAETRAVWLSDTPPTQQPTQRGDTMSEATR